MLLKAFQLCFWVGVLFTAVSFILGQLFDLTEFDADFDTDSDTNTTGSGKGETIISPFKPVVIAAFITVFGGVGIIGLHYLELGALITLAMALVSALSTSFLMYRFLIVPLYKAQSTSAVSQKELIGFPAKVQLDIKGGGFGRITYIVNNNTYSAPAKSVDNEEILKGSKVAIVDINKNIFMVTKM
ncbi:NfeD family protein [Desulfoscipio gibsoniae]|uniref:NfeD-like protein n=1 Tax=Desulfoscipio gibsoniae DSM 7213 TaxID=767817 RepID=R4KI24_9FIRM|nr:NfeD family protein [Desulfoscipio gibsoniae]AGL02264.1 NfeD-like protein [Desulfoscipio gibsoniae DSM 7213]